MVKDIATGPDGLAKDANPTRLGAVGSTLFFSSSEGTVDEGCTSDEFGRFYPCAPADLWKSDGTKAGTKLVKEIDESDECCFGLTDVGGRLFFRGPGGLWTSDGTAAGTKLLVSSGRGTHLTNVAGTAYFVGDDKKGNELWRSDGTTAGTRRVKDIRRGTRSSEPFRLTRFGKWLFFTANDGKHGAEPWVSKGTRARTRLVKDIRPGRFGSMLSDDSNGFGPRMVTAGRMLFFAADDGKRGRELWVWRP